MNFKFEISIDPAFGLFLFRVFDRTRTITWLTLISTKSPTESRLLLHRTPSSILKIWLKLSLSVVVWQASLQRTPFSREGRTYFFSINKGQSPFPFHSFQISSCPSFMGGNSTKATSGINGAGTQTQQEHGIPDNPNIFFEDTKRSVRLFSVYSPCYFSH